MTNPPKEPEFSKIMELWSATDLKVQILVFYHDNPGTIETIDGLAKRLGTNIDTLRKEMADNVANGLFKERQVNGRVLLVFDRDRDADVKEAIEQRFRNFIANQKGVPR
ncbi:MAG: hypothetical protein QOI63_112 [Thermoplasmata archaeon]|jgi:hypothetical protein|nr:hypothetical protein [Thermoplasmata archaeon]